MKKLHLFLFLVFAMGPASHAQDSIQVMFYNLFRFPTSPPANRELLLRDLIDSVKPDLFMACEIVNEAGASRILNSSFSGLPDSFAKAEFIYCQTALEDPLQQMVFYNTRKFILIRQQTHPTTVRDINHYTFILNLEHLPQDSVFVDVFVAHLKSSDGLSNRLLRLGMVDTFINALEKIPDHHHVIFAGDFNFYKASTEPAYQKILDSTNLIRMIDPINMPGNWHDNPDFSAIHTQATRVSAVGFGLGGATGGLDDRFDFIMISENTKDNPEFSYIENTYKAYGNNGNCFDKSIHDTSCTGIYSMALREKLHNMSDHTPVIMQFATNQSFNTSISQIPKEKIKLLGSNVVEDYLILKILPNQILSDQLILYNIFGQVLKMIPINNHTNTISIDLQNLAPGHYFIRVAKEGGSPLRFIKK